MANEVQQEWVYYSSCVRIYYYFHASHIVALGSIYLINIKQINMVMLNEC